MGEGDEWLPEFTEFRRKTGKGWLQFVLKRKKTTANWWRELRGAVLRKR